MQDVLGAESRLSLRTPAERVARMLREHLAADVGIWGRLERTEGGEALTVRAIDLTGVLLPRPRTKRFTAEGQRSAALLARQVVEWLTGVPVKRPREVGDVRVPARFGRAVNRNGSFEAGSGERPLGWQRIDGLTSFWVQDPTGSGRGKVIKMDTRVLQSQASRWWERWRAGAAASDAPEPVFAKPPYYDAVAGLHGVHFYSDFYRVEPNRRYWIVADVCGRSGKFVFPKVFIKGYAVVAGGVRERAAERREVWNTYVACRGLANHKWKHFCQEFVPPAGVRWIRVVLYAHWPPGVYYWDNVWVYEDRPDTDATSARDGAAGTRSAKLGPAGCRQQP